MKPNDLRIGNWVNCSIYNGNKDVDIQFTFEEYKYIHLFKPIPITEEWLLKFGFEKRVQGVCDYFHIGKNEITHDYLFTLTWLKTISGEYERFPFYKNGRHEIKYVHQLQNLYFALTLEELTIKE